MKRFVANTVLFAGALFLGLVIVEGGLRLLPGKYGMWMDYYSADRSTISYKGLDGGIHILRPIPRARKHGPCFEVSEIGVNEQGFRDQPWTEGTSGFRISLLGDSFIGALQVPDGQDVSSQLERLLGFEVLNTGISGYSTITELEAYRRLVRPYKPHLVVLFMYLGNDVKGNSCSLDQERSLCGELKGGKISYRGQTGKGLTGNGAESRLESHDSANGEINDSKQNILSKLKDFFRRNLVLYGALHDLKMVVFGLANQVTGHVSTKWQLYMNEDQPVWRDAWEVTADVLAALKMETKADNTELAVVTIPEHFAYSPNWKLKLILGAGTAIPTGFDPTGPALRLAKITSDLGIPTLDLLPGFLAYRDKVNLPNPYFSFACDGHWNPLTHYLAAHEVAVFLNNNSLLPEGMAGKREITEKRNAAFARKPRDILGDEAYRQIFNGGFYTGEQDSR